MKRSTKCILAAIGIVVLAVPLFLFGWLWKSRLSTKVRTKTEAARLVEQFHREYNSHDVDAICRMAYKCGEYPNTRDSWQLALEDTRSHGGAFKNIVRADIEISIEPPSVRANVVSSFEKGEIREVFTMNDFDGSLKIATYGRVFTPSGRSASTYGEDLAVTAL